MSLSVDVRARRHGFVLEAAFEAGRETVAVLGPNGAGKSTLVAVLAGLLRPEAGRVVLDGAALDDGAVHVPPHGRAIGVLFQGALLLPHLSALDNVAFPLRARGVTGASARARARLALADVDAAHLASAKPAALSGGETQRVAIARALVTEPRLLLLDEPLTALDVSARTSVRSVFRRVLAGFDGVAIVVTHDPVDAMTLAGRIVVLEHGRITQAGSLDEVRAAPRTPYAADLIGVNLFAGRLEVADGSAILHTPDGDVSCMAPDGTTGPVEGALGVLKPADVSIFLERPAGSARNVLSGPVTTLEVERDRARIGIGSSPPVVAEITVASLRDLGLAEGTRVWASFKALEVRVVLP